ncbi:response regulator [Dietzia sp. 179-F 9C3 NHS]|uniref:response regulator n=1 Tax=Dietzia sp. 179-F 9C3 NHS TaxID=3374295 RepID=UPI003879D750
MTASRPLLPRPGARLVILVLEDEPEVRDALEADLAPFADVTRVEPAEDVDDAYAVLDEVDADGDLLALVLADHRLPGRSGTDFLVDLVSGGRYPHVRTVLVTGQADHADTIRAVNLGGLDHYIAKPWDTDDLRAQVRRQLTEFVLRARIDPVPHLRALETERALEEVRRRSEL